MSMLVTDEQIEVAIGELKGGSVKAIVALTLMVIRDGCPYGQFWRIAVALYDIVDNEHIDRFKEIKANDPNAKPFQQVMALRSLSCIVARWLSEQVMKNCSRQTISDFVTRWPTIHKWILHLKEEYVDNCSVDIEFRIATKRSLVDFIGLASHTSLAHFLPTAFHSPLISHTLFSLWRLEMQDRRFYCPTNCPGELGLPDIYTTPGILDCCQARLVFGQEWNWDEIIRQSFDNDGKIMGLVALSQLRSDMELFPMNYDRIISDLHLLTVFSLKMDVRMAILRHGSMPTVVGLMSFLVNAEHPPNVHPLVAKALSFATWYIRAYVEDTDALPWITQVLEAGILKAMVLIEPYIQHLPSSEWQFLHELFREVIPRYTVYQSILKLLVKYVKEIEEAGWAKKFEKENSPISNAWGILNIEVESKQPLLGATPGLNLNTCQNIKCGKTAHAGTFRQCEGCLHFYYCSKECQAYDWDFGGHQRYCRSIQARRSNGTITYPSESDIRFFDSVIEWDLDAYGADIHKHVATNPNTPIAVEFDYTWIEGMKRKIEPANKMAPPPTCKCEEMIHLKWQLMLELAQKAKTPRVLVRAFIPCGTMPKIKLQLVPLSRIPPEYGGDCGEELYEGEDFDDTFDLLYEYAGVQLSYMDSEWLEVNQELLHKCQ